VGVGPDERDVPGLSRRRARGDVDSPVPAIPLRIGDLHLRSGVLLAPIAGYSDLAHRLVCREQGGVGLAFTDLLSPQGLLRGTMTSLDLARTCDEDAPLGMQLYGSDPAMMTEGAAWAVAHGAAVVDINMGCPVDKVCKRDGGSKLMCDPDRAVRIADAVRAALPPDVPLTCKMRLGWDEAGYGADVAGTLACRLADAGAAAITVHGRTAEQRFGGECRREGIRRVVEMVRDRTRGWASGPVPVIGNGDLRTPDDCARMILETGCDGVMIGRGALGAPWLPGQVWRYLASGAILPAPDDEAQVSLLRRLFELMRRYRGDRHALDQVRKRVSWFGRHIAGGHCKDFKEAIRLAGSVADVERALDGFASSRLAAAQVRWLPGFGTERCGSAAPRTPSRTASRSPTGCTR
jgi:tRNA-dihydrouridine synthase B